MHTHIRTPARADMLSRTAVDGLLPNTQRTRSQCQYTSITVSIHVNAHMCTPARADMLSRNAVDGLLLLELTEEDLEAELRIDDELHRSLIMGALKDIVGTVLLHTSIYRGIHPFIEAYILSVQYYATETRTHTHTHTHTHTPRAKRSSP